MNLGETIYKLRTQANLSQEELANQLEVSRQSVSKWETNSSIPDLDKLIKLSEIFGVTIDEMVKTEKREKCEKCENEVKLHAKRNKIKKLGIVLLCISFLMLLLVGVTNNSKLGLMAFLPIFGGLICLYVKRNIDLWCGWCIYLFIDIYIRISLFPAPAWWRYILGWQFDEKYGALIVASWIAFFIFVALTILTIRRFGKLPLELGKYDLFMVMGAWLIYFLIEGQLSNIVLSGLSIESLRFHALDLLTSNFKLLCFEMLLVYTIRHINSCRMKSKDM